MVNSVRRSTMTKQNRMSNFQCNKSSALKYSKKKLKSKKPSNWKFRWKFTPYFNAHLESWEPILYSKKLLNLIGKKILLWGMHLSRLSQLRVTRIALSQQVPSPHLLLRRREESRHVLPRSNSPLLPHNPEGPLVVAVDVVTEPNEYLGIEVKDSIPNRLQKPIIASITYIPPQKVTILKK